MARYTLHIDTDEVNIHRSVDSTSPQSIAADLLAAAAEVFPGVTSLEDPIVLMAQLRQALKKITFEDASGHTYSVLETCEKVFRVVEEHVRLIRTIEVMEQAGAVPIVVAVASE